MYQLDSRKYWSDPNVPIQFEFRNPQSPFPLHIHDFHEIVLVYSGKATHLTPAGDHDIHGGYFLNIKPGQAHGYKNIRNLVLMNVLIKPIFFQDDLFGLGSLPAFDTLFSQEADKEMIKSPILYDKLEYGIFNRARELVEDANAELTGRNAGYRAMVVCLIQELIIMLIRNLSGIKETMPGFAQSISTLLNYVKQNYRSPLCMSDLTGFSGMSDSHVLRVFNKYQGCSPFKYINRLRLESASDMLIQTDKSITDIALDLGYNDSNYFTRMFRKHKGLSPREFRIKYLKENLL